MVIGNESVLYGDGTGNQIDGKAMFFPYHDLLDYSKEPKRTWLMRLVNRFEKFCERHIPDNWQYRLYNRIFGKLVRWAKPDVTWFVREHQRLEELYKGTSAEKTAGFAMNYGTISMGEFIKEFNNE